MSSVDQKTMFSLGFTVSCFSMVITLSSVLYQSTIYSLLRCYFINQICDNIFYLHEYN